MALNRRNTLIGLGTLAGGLGIIGGTGAFDTVEANRDFTVEVDGDASALLQLEAIDDEYVENVENDDDNELLEITIDESGVNDEAVTTFHDLFGIGNNGTEEVEISFEVINSEDDEDHAEGVTVFDSNEDSDYGLMGDEDESQVVGTDEIGGDPEDAPLVVGLEIDTRGEDGYTEPEDEYTLVITAEVPDE